ncbi:MAG TPA: AAA family ATPase [Polyangiaceae bacterium]
MAEPLATTGSLEQNRIAGRYLLQEKIGAGGMASVHRALDETTGRVIALKRLSSSKAGAQRRTIEALFEREYHTLVRLKHPRIIQVYDYGLTDDGRYYTMDLLDGQDLDQLGVQSPEAACRLLRDLASSLALIHAHRLLHRDVSPRNIRLTRDGRPKLIDFGAISPFGIADDIIGTPPCVAPELLRGDPLDQRADLFGLGAVAYWMLTGRHAYPARHMQDLLTVWETAPPLPSRFAKDVPPELDALVLSLLSQDRLARPLSAGAVIEELTRIAGLEPEEYEHTAQSYLLSGRVTGRDAELKWLGKRVERARKGRGAPILIEGPPGIGKTCLLREASVAARLRGAVTLKADARAIAEPFGLAALLAVEMLDACPEVARRAAGDDAGLLAELSPQLKEKLKDVPIAAVPRDPSERRARFQTALHRWFLAVLRERVLFVAVDNVQAADDNSAAFLAALACEASRTQLVLAVTSRTGESAVAKAAMRMLRKRSRRLKLGPLSAPSCEELVRSLFGDIPNSGRAAKLLFEKSAGVPQQCMDLAQLLVTKQIAQYSAGTWSLPQDIAEGELPSRTEELMAARLAGLSASALQLAESLSIHSKPVTLEHCLALADARAESDTYAALDELVAEQILCSDSGSYRFAHDALRRALLDNFDEPRRRASHIRAAEALLAAAPERAATRLEAAVHLLDAGEENRGAELLAQIGMGLTSAVDFNAVSEAVLALDRALDCFERQGRSEHEHFALLFPLVKLAYYSPHFKIILERGERALEVGMRITGLAAAHELRLAGREKALETGLGLGARGFAAQPGLGYDLKTAIVASCGILPSICGAAAVCLDTERVDRIANLVEPLTLFGPEHVARVLHGWAPLESLVVHGRDGEAQLEAERCLEQNRAPQVREAMGEVNWRSQYGGLAVTRCLYDAYRFGDGALRGIEELEQLGIRVWAMAAAQIRLLYHAYRGESEEVQRYRERVELFAVQGSTTWQIEMFWPALLLSADVMTGDVIGARRIAEQLARAAKDVASLRKYADAAQAAQALLRGHVRQAVALYENVLPEFPLRGRPCYERTWTHYAQALNLVGNHARAKAVALEVISGMVEADRRHFLFLDTYRQLALAEAGLGNHGEAVQILDRLLDEHGHQDNRLVIGLLHKARAEVALMTSDAAAFEVHASEMEQRFRSTRNPALIAQCERLLDRAARLGVRELEPMGVEDAEAIHGLRVTTGGVSELEQASDPAARALALVVSRANARSGCLYLRREGGMQRVAATGTSPTPRFLEIALSELADEAPSVSARAQGPPPDTSPVASTSSSFTGSEAAVSALDDTDDDLGETQAFTSDAASSSMAQVRSVQPPGPSGVYQLVLLEARQTERRVVIGGLILEASAHDVARLRVGLLRGIAQVLLKSERQATTVAMSHVTEKI